MIKNLKLFSIAILLLFFACATPDNNLKDMVEYKGPLAVLKNVETFYSDSALVRIKMIAPKQIEETDGNQKFPKGIRIEFFNSQGIKYSYMVANSGVYTSSTGIFTAVGNVVVIDSLEDKKLNTELLHWDRKNKTIYTDKFVTIVREGNVLTGDGLTAAQDFSTWKLTNPKGQATLENDEEEEE